MKVNQSTAIAAQNVTEPESNKSLKAVLSELGVDQSLVGVSTQGMTEIGKQLLQTAQALLSGEARPAPTSEKMRESLMAAMSGGHKVKRFGFSVTDVDKVLSLVESGKGVTVKLGGERMTLSSSAALHTWLEQLAEAGRKQRNDIARADNKIAAQPDRERLLQVALKLTTETNPGRWVVHPSCTATEALRALALEQPVELRRDSQWGFGREKFEYATLSSLDTFREFAKGNDASTDETHSNLRNVRWPSISGGK